MTKWVLRLSALLSLGTLTAAILVTFLVAPLVQAASKGPNSPDTVADVDHVQATQAWSNDANAAASDNAYATCIGGVSIFAQCEYEQATDFDFAIPSGATINGIVAEIEAKSSTGTGSFCDVLIVKGGSITGTDQNSCTTIGTSDTYYTFGSSSNLWGTTWTDTEINATNFGFVVRGAETDLGTATISIDHMRVTVHYTAGGAPAAQTREVKVISIF